MPYGAARHCGNRSRHASRRNAPHEILPLLLPPLLLPLLLPPPLLLLPLLLLLRVAAERPWFGTPLALQPQPAINWEQWGKDMDPKLVLQFKSAYECEAGQEGRGGFKAQRASSGESGEVAGEGTCMGRLASCTPLCCLLAAGILTSACITIVAAQQASTDLPRFYQNRAAQMNCFVTLLFCGLFPFTRSHEAAQVRRQGC